MLALFGVVHPLRKYMWTTYALCGPCVFEACVATAVDGVMRRRVVVMRALSTKRECCESTMCDDQVSEARVALEKVYSQVPVGFVL